MVIFKLGIIPREVDPCPQIAGIKSAAEGFGILIEDERINTSYEVFWYKITAKDIGAVVRFLEFLGEYQKFYYRLVPACHEITGMDIKWRAYGRWGVDNKPPKLTDRDLENIVEGQYTLIIKKKPGEIKEGDIATLKKALSYLLQNSNIGIKPAENKIEAEVKIFCSKSELKEAKKVIEKHGYVVTLAPKTIKRFF